MPRNSQSLISDEQKEKIRDKIKLLSLKERQNFQKKHPKSHKSLLSKQLDLGKLREHSAKALSAGAITGALLLTPPSLGHQTTSAPSEIINSLKQDKSITPELSQENFLKELSSVLPGNIRPLDHAEEKLISQLIKKHTNIQAKATLEGEHLNTSYGRIGAEQHLKRYPGDALANHGQGTILKEGIAPGLGAWGYFSPSKNLLTPALEETEKWYAVVQTLYLPDWNTRQPYLRNWYKYRKVLIVNTDNGNAVVAAIADSGPAAWTGKHFGGSPEVMMHLGCPRYKKGPVVLFFVDDPQNQIPLGPVEYNDISQIPESMLVNT